MPLSSATFVDNRASDKVPLTKAAALRPVSPLPSPPKEPRNPGALNNTDTVLSLRFAHIRSILPSPFTSPADTDEGAPPTFGEATSTKPPLPLLVSTDSVLSPLLAETKSTLPSPFTSVAITETGAVP